MNLTDLPRDIYSNILINLPREETKAFTSTSKEINKLREEVKYLLSLDNPDAKTAIYEGYHMTEYQTAMMRDLLKNGKDSKYKHIPDYYNLCIVGFLYAVEMTKHMTVGLTVDNNFTFLDNILSISSLKRIYNSIDRSKLTINTMTINDPEYRIGLFIKHKPSHVNIAFYVHDQEYNNIHPSYETVYKHKVWVSNKIFNSSKELPKGRVCFISLGGSSIPKTIFNVDEIQYPINTNVIDKYDIFIVYDKLLIQDIFSILSQHSKKEKMLITGYTSTIRRDIAGKYHEKTRTQDGYLPLPYKFILDTPSFIPLSFSNALQRINGFTYAELVILSSYSGKGDNITMINQWLEDMTENKKALELVFKTIDTVDFDVDLPKITIPVIKVLNNVIKEESKPWILLDPNQNIEDIPISSFDPTQ